MARDNIKVAKFSSVPIGLPHKRERKLAVRGVSRSRLIAADVSYGFKPADSTPEFLV